MNNAIYKLGFSTTLVTTALLVAYGCTQPPPKCAAARGGFATTYKKISGPASCDAVKGELLGISTYQAEGKDEKPDLDRSSIAIQSESLGVAGDDAAAAGLPDPDKTHKPYALGDFDSAEPKGDFCSVPKLTAAIQNFPEVPADQEKKTEAVPATSIKYEWTNVKFYVTALKLGTQFSATLTRTVDADVCVYSAVGLNPPVGCAKAKPADPKVPEPDISLCSPVADIDAGRRAGSGIDPDYAVKCAPITSGGEDSLECVVANDSIPALK
jgi:hypothetical protein